MIMMLDFVKVVESISILNPMRSFYLVIFSIFLLLNITPLCAHDSLLFRLQEAEKGDYVVTSQNKSFTLWHVIDHHTDSLIIEEVTLPKKTWNKLSLTWKEWLAKKAPKNNSWVMYELDLKTGKILEYYSFTRRAWIDTNISAEFLHSLLKLSFLPVPRSQRKNLGIGGHLWQPPLTVEGERVRQATFEAWSAKWPKDGSELANKIMEAYFPEKSKDYPYYFPYWLWVKGQYGRIHMRVYDSGKHMSSPYTVIPRPIPELVRGPIIEKDEALTFHLRARAYYKKFILSAVAMDLHFTNYITLDSKTLDMDSGGYKVMVTKKELYEKLEADKSYFFYLTPENYREVSLEIQRPFNLKNMKYNEK